MISFLKLLQGDGGLRSEPLDPADISEVRKDKNKIIWMDVESPTQEDLDMLEAEFGFHRLALEDCLHAHQRPKLERYPDFLFLVLYEVHLEGDRLRPVEFEIFLGANYVVTVHQHAAPRLIGEVEQRWEAIERFGEEGASFLAYLLIDAAVDTYFPTLDDFSDRLEALEEQIFEGFDTRVVSRIFQLKKQTLQLRKLITPLRDVFLTLLRRDEPYFGPHTYLYFQDILDHLLRISDAIDTLRDLMGSAVDAYLSSVSNRTNDTMKKLTVLSTVLMSMALIAGIYGMNFKIMPELNWDQGYYYALSLMLLVALVLAGLFKWRKYI